MGNQATIKFCAITIDCPDPLTLADFYGKLLGWVVVYSDEEYACIGVPNTKQGQYPSITFQKNMEYTPPVWPETEGEQQQMAHLDLAVNDLANACRRAVALGATETQRQYSDMWKVMLDPVGHPFCLVAMRDILESPDCGLR